MKNPSEMSQAELDIYSDMKNPNNDADMNEWANDHNPNNEDYIGDQD